MSKEQGSDLRQCERFALDADIEFFVDADIVHAQSVDVSQTGLSFRTDNPLLISMRMELEGQVEERRAKILWASRQWDGSVRYGLEFIDEEKPDKNL